MKVIAELRQNTPQKNTRRTSAKTITPKVMNPAKNNPPHSSAEISAVQGELNYLADSAKSSLYRNGKVLTRRDQDGNDGVYQGVDLKHLNINIHNARQLDEPSRPTLDPHGFELISCPTEKGDLDFYNQQQVVQMYYKECAATIKRITGASQVFAFDHNLRSASGKQNKKRISGGQQVQEPLRIVHGDYTLTSAPQRLRDMTVPPRVNDTLSSILGKHESLLDHKTVEHALNHNGRYAIINLWRNIASQPVATYPLALCDGQTVDPTDLVVFEIHYHDRIGENYFAKYSPNHKWWYYPAMTNQEALLIKQWDSSGGLAQSQGADSDSSSGEDDTSCTFSFHSAFKEPDTPQDAPDRQSIEVRCIVLYG